MNQRRLQFGLLTLVIVTAATAMLFAVVRPGVFPNDSSIREDLAIHKSIPIRVFDRQTISKLNGESEYWATVHVAENPHRLVRVRCTANSSLSNRQKWAVNGIIDHYDNGSFEVRACERLYSNAPTEKEIAEFRQFVLDFK